MAWNISGSCLSTGKFCRGLRRATAGLASRAFSRRERQSKLRNDDGDRRIGCLSRRYFSGGDRARRARERVLTGIFQTARRLEKTRNGGLQPPIIMDGALEGAAPWQSHSICLITKMVSLIAPQ